MAGRMTLLTASKAATDDRMTPMVATNRAAMADRTIALTVITRRPATVSPTNRIRTPRAGTNARTMSTGATKAATVDPTKAPTDGQKTPVGVTEAMTDPTETPRKTMVDPMTTRMATKKAATVDPMTTHTVTKKAPTVNPTAARTETPGLPMGDRTTPMDGRKTLGVPMEDRTKPTVDRKTPPEAPPPVMVHRMTTLIREAMVDLVTTTVLVLTAKRRNLAVVRGRDLRLGNIC